ncbi:MAG: hypothetical protein ACR2MO_10515 [Acidimicrobiales bacterium]
MTTLVGACATGAAPESELLADAREPVQEMLQERARRLTAGDVEGYLRPMTPEARAVEEPIARGAVAAPISEVNLAMDEADFDPDGTLVTSARVDFVYRYRDLPQDNEFRFRLDYEMERRNGSWVVTSSKPDPEVFGAVPMWATGPVQVARSPHFVALFRPGLAEVDQSLQLAEQARGRLLERLTLTPDPVHLLVLARDHAEFIGFLGEEVPQGVLAATEYIFSQTRAHDARPVKRGMVVNVDSVLRNGSRVVDLDAGHAKRLDGSGAGMGGMTIAGAQMGGGHGGPPQKDPQPKSEITATQVFQHELGHLALSRFTRRSTAAWVVEGGAMQLSGERRVNTWRFLLENPDLFEDQALSFSSLEAVQLDNALQYGYVNAAVAYLVDTFGAEKFWGFYRDFKEYDRGSEAHPLEELWPDATHRLLRRTYDLDEDQLDVRTREYMQEAVGIRP